MLQLAISANTLFALDDAHRIYHAQGKNAFDTHMTDRIDDILPLGPLGPFIQALGKTGLVRIHLYSRISPAAGERINRSLKAHGIPVVSQTYTDSTPVYIFAKTIRPHLYLSSDDNHARDAIEMGVPAVYLLPTSGNNQAIDTLRIAMDFDGFIATHEADIRTHHHGLDFARNHDLEHQDTPMQPGTFMPLMVALSGLRQELKRDPSNIQLELAIITARGERESPRMLKTLKFWHVEVDKILLMDGKPKGPAAQEFGAHMFFDDNPKNCHNVAQHNIPTFHAIHGITNTNYVPRDKTILYAANGQTNPELKSGTEHEINQGMQSKPDNRF